MGVTASGRENHLYPELVALKGGRVTHDARFIRGGPFAATLCGKRGESVAAEPDTPHCRACLNRPNPIKTQSFR